MKTIAQKINEILSSGQPVISQVLGCMGDIERADNEGMIYLKKKNRRGGRNIGGGCFGMNHPLNFAELAIKKIKGKWILGNRKTHSQKMFKKHPEAALGEVFKNWGI